MTTSDDRSILDAIGATPLVRVGRGTFRTGKNRLCVYVCVCVRSRGERSYRHLLLCCCCFQYLTSFSFSSYTRLSRRLRWLIPPGFSPSPLHFYQHTLEYNTSPDRTSDRESGPGLGQVRNAKSWGKFLFPYYSTCVRQRRLVLVYRRTD